MKKCLFIIRWLIYALLFMFITLNTLIFLYAILGHFKLGFINDIFETEIYTNVLKKYGVIKFFIISNTILIKAIGIWVFLYPVCIAASWFLFMGGTFNKLGDKIQTVAALVKT